MSNKKPIGMVLPPELRSKQGIETWAGRYSPYARHTDRFILDMLQNASQRKANRGYMTRDELLMVDEWKNSGRHRQYIIRNKKNVVFEKSRRAFANEDITSLTGPNGVGGLRGVGLATASAIMHFVFPNKYPIIDANALSTLGIKSSEFYKLWNAYQEICCIWSRKYRVKLRILDRALWQYGLELKDRSVHK